MKKALLIAALGAALGAEILDRTVAIVGDDSILASEVEAQVRLEAMFSDQPIDPSEQAREAALERLIDQRLIQSQIDLSGFQAEEDEELDRQIQELAAQTFAGMPFAEALKHYGVRAEQAQDFLRRQLRFADYVGFRFRSGLEASPEAVRNEYRRRFGNRENPPPFEAIEDELAENVRIRAAESALENRIRALRVSTRIVRLPLLQAGTKEPEEGPTR